MRLCDGGDGGDGFGESVSFLLLRFDLFRERVLRMVAGVVC